MINNVESFELIKRKLLSDDGHTVQLNERQHEMMKRWDYVIELRTCENLTTPQIVQKLIETHGVERATAYNDIGYAEALFGYSTPLNKRYRIGARINYLEEQIQKLTQKEYFKEAAMLESVLQRYYEMYPEVKAIDTQRNINYIYNGEQLMEELPQVENAIEMLKLAAVND